MAPTSHQGEEGPELASGLAGTSDSGASGLPLGFPCPPFSVLDPFSQAGIRARGSSSGSYVFASSPGVKRDFSLLVLV